MGGGHWWVVAVFEVVMWAYCTQPRTLTQRVLCLLVAVLEVLRGVLNPVDAFDATRPTRRTKLGFNITIFF